MQKIVRRFQLSSMACYALLVLLSLIYTLLWYKEQVLAIGGDYVYPFNAGLIVNQYSSYWNFWKDFGNAVPPLLTAIPIIETMGYGALTSLTKDPVLATKTFAFILTSIESASFYYFVTVILPNYSWKRPLGLVASLINLYNPVRIQSGYLTIVEPLVPRAFLPLFLGVTICGLRRQKLSYAPVAGLVSIPLLELFPIRTWQLSFICAGAIGLYLSFSWIFRKVSPNDLRFTALFLGLVALSVSVANIHNLVLLISTIDVFTATAASFQPNFFFNNWATAFNVLRLVPLWGFYNGYVPYASVYQEPTVMLATLAIPALAFSSLLLTRSRSITSLAVVSAIAILLSVATNPPVGYLYSILVTHVFLLKVFYNSEPIIQFVLPLGISILAAFSVIEITRRTHAKFAFKLVARNLVTIFIPLLLISLIMTSGWPLLTGDVMANWSLPGTRGVSIPPEYFEAEKTISRNHCFCWSLVLPRPSDYVVTSWGYAGTVLLYNTIFNDPLITGRSVSYYVGQKVVAGALDLVYEVPVRIVVNRTLTETLGNSTGTVWTSFQGDLVGVAADLNPYSNTSVYWSIQRPEIGKWHEIVYTLPNATAFSDANLVILIDGRFDPRALQLGIGDVGGNVGWYSVVNRRDLTTGWLTSEIDPHLPEQGHFDPLQVRSLFMRYLINTEVPVEVRIGAIVFGRHTTDGTTWAKMLSLYSIEHIIVDLSVELGNLTKARDYLEGLNESAAFELIFSGAFVQVFRNRYHYGSMVFTASRTYIFDDSKQAYTALSIIDPWTSNTSMLFVNDVQQSIVSRINSLNGTGGALLQTASWNGRVISASVFSATSFLLVLNQAYDSNWVLYVNDIPAVDHLKVQGYANGWIVDTTGQVKLRIEYSRQQIVAVATLSSLVGVAVLVMLAIVLSKSEGKNRRAQR